MYSAYMLLCIYTVFNRYHCTYCDILYVHTQTSTMSDTARPDVATTERTQRTGTHSLFSTYYYCIITDPCLYVYMYVFIYTVGGVNESAHC